MEAHDPWIKKEGALYQQKNGTLWQTVKPDADQWGYACKFVL